jgi:hypothetical protein
MEDHIDLFGAHAATHRPRRHQQHYDQREDMNREARQHAAGGRSPGCHEPAPSGIHDCHQSTSLGRDEFDLQIVDARLREIDDAQDSLVVQAVISE